MAAQDFILAYEAALATQDWSHVAPLVADDARVVFSDGTLHAGKDAIRAAFSRNFDTIKNETYKMTNVYWLFEAADSAAYLFEFHWSGAIDGRAVSGAGRGMTVLARRAEQWVLLGETLGPLPSA